MPKSNTNPVARRRLDLVPTKDDNESKSTIVNPYAKAPKPSLANVQEVDKTATTDLQNAVTPEAGIAKFFIKKKTTDSTIKPKPHARRKLVTPLRNEKQEQTESETNKKRKSLEIVVDHEDEVDTKGLYYSSGDDEQNENLYKPERIHSSLDYHHRGELSLPEGMLKAYRFVRNNFLIPRDIESDPTFGPWSGSCFEERVLRAYSLGELIPKRSNMKCKWETKSSLAVCTYCGKEGHKRDRCLELL